MVMVFPLVKLLHAFDLVVPLPTINDNGAIGQESDKVVIVPVPEVTLTLPGTAQIEFASPPPNDTEPVVKSQFVQENTPKKFIP
jgi:hypothetical protein